MDNLHLYLGVSGDGPVCHLSTTTPGVYAGHSVMGPEKFVEWLEMQLGLPGIFPSAIERAISLKKLITEDKRPSFFFSKSFASDPLGVTKRLLALWDSWIASGWDIKASRQLPSRMAALAGIKAVFDQCGPGLPARARLVLENLPSPMLQPVLIHLVDAPEQFPFIVQQVLSKLKDAIVPDYENIKPQAVAGTDLWKLQNLVQGKKPAEPLSNDHSLQLIFFDDDIAEANAIYSMQSAGAWNPVIINSDNSLLNGLHVSQNHPVCQWQTIGGNGQVSQLFFLATALFRRPVNTSQVIAFLSAPLTPLPKKLSASLVRAFARRPGFGNEGWNKATETFLASIAGDDNEKTALKRIAFWLQNKDTLVEPCFSIALLQEIYTQLGVWASQSLHQSYSSLYTDQLLKLSSLCQQLVSVLQGEGELIAVSKFERLQSELFTEVPTTIAEAQLGSADYFSSPNALWWPCKELLWMNATRFEPKDYATKYWYQEEKAWFVQQGLPLHDESHAAATYYSGLKRMIASVTRRLVISVPAISNGVIAAKPYCLDEWNTLICTKPVTLAPGHLLERLPWDADTKLLQEYPAINLPTPVTYFSIEKENSRREKESYTSIEKLIQHPAEWYMDYVLKLRYFDGIAVPNANIIKGVIADSVVQQLFTEENMKAKWWQSGKTFLEKLDEVCDTILLQEGLPFLEKHTKRLLMEYKLALAHSVSNLKNLVDSNHLKIIATQATVSGMIDGTPFEGYVDMVLQAAQKNMVIDLKWANSSRTYRDKIKEGSDLQLVLYAQALGKDVGSGYFMLNDGNAYMRNEPNHQGLLQVQYLDAEEGIDSAEVYRRAVNALQYRRRELAAGRAEAGYDAPLAVLDYFRDTQQLGLYALKENNQKKQAPFDEDYYLFYGKII